MQQQNRGPGVVVVGSDFKALGVVRSLGKRGIPSVVIDNTPRSAWFSRYVVKRLRWHGPMDDVAFLNFLLSTGKRHHLEQWVLIPLADEVVELIARNRSQLMPIYQLVTQEWDVVQKANNKHLTYRMAEETGVPYPKTWYPACEDDLSAMEITFPAIIKPATSARLQYALRLKVLTVGSDEELLTQYRLAAAIIDPEHIMIQEIIPGDGRVQYSVATYCKEGHIVSGMTARRTRQYPIDYGLSSTFVEAIEVPELFELAQKLLDHMRVSGMVEVEFKYDSRDEQYKLLDINVRPWGWHSLCASCGLDFPAIQYDDILGKDPTSIIPRYGYHWIRLLTDIPAGLQEIRAGITTPGVYLRSLMGKSVFSVFDWRDPLPALGDVASAVVRMLPSYVSRLRPRRSQFQANKKEEQREEISLVAALPARLKEPATASVFPEKSRDARKTSPVRSPSIVGLTSPASNKDIGAVVIGGDFQGLGIIRSLGRHGIPVCVIDDEHSISRFSRYATHHERVADLRDERRTVDAILDVGQRLGLEGWVLYPTRDETVAAFSHYRPQLAEWFRVPTPDWSTVKWAWDKRNTYQLAQELGIPTPQTWYPEDLSELESIEVTLPAVIKPAIKEHFIYATKAKAWRANSRTELAERFKQARDLVGPGEVMIQELIPGGGQQQFAYCAFFKDDHALGSMTVQRRRQHPPEFGRASTFVETIDLPILESLSERFLQAINYYGLVEMEYKLDPRDGQYKLLDVNARTWGYHTLGQQAGVDFPYMLFADQLGEQVETYRAKAGIRWIRLVTDLSTGALEMLRGRIDWKTYLQSLAGFHIESVFSREDPLPGLVELSLVPYLFMKRGF